IGAVVDADVGIAILSLSSDYTYNSQSGSNGQGAANPGTTRIMNTFRILSGLSFLPLPPIDVGINDVWTRADRVGDAPTGNVNSFSVGPFIRGQLSRLTDLYLAGGAILVHAHPSEPPGYYFSGVLRHQINRNWQLILSASHDLVFTTGTSLTEESAFRLGTQMNLTRFITFSAFPFINFGDVKGVTNPGHFKQYGFDTGLGWNLRKHWYTGLNYTYIRRNGTSASDSYIQNIVGFRVGYRF